MVDKPASKFFDHHSTSTINLFKQNCTCEMVCIIGYTVGADSPVHLKATNGNFNTKSKHIGRFAPDEKCQ